MALDGIKRLRSEGLSPDKYIQITNQIATAKFKMEQDLESSFGTFLKPPRKANVKPNEGLRALKDGYDELIENVKKDFVVQAEKAKAAVIEAYRAHNMEEGDNKFRTWKQWAVFLESEKASRDLWEIQTLQVGLVDSYKEAALGEYAALRLEKGDEQQHTWLKLVEEHDNKPKPSELSELAAARTACIVARARSLFDQSCQAYQGDDPETGDKQRDVWLDQLKGAGREPDQAAVGQIAKARTACLERVAQHLFDQSFQAYRSDKLEVGHGFHAKWKELDVPRKRADEEKLTSEEVACKKRLEVEKTTIEQKAFALTALEKAIESAKNRLNAEDVKKIRPEQTALRTAIDAAQKFSLNTEEARAVAEQLAQRIGALTQAVPITLAQGALLDPAVVTEWSVDNEHWQVWTPAVKVEPGQVWVRFLRNDYERQGPKALAVEPVKGCLVAVPEARAWQAGEALTRLNNLRAWVRDKEWVRASAYTNDMRIGLVDPKHRQDWEVLVKGVVGHFDQIKDKRDQQGKAAALVASLSALKTELGNNKTDGFAKFVWPCPEKNIAGLPQVVAAGNEFASVLSNWVVTVACVDDPLASRQARLSEAAGVLGASAVVNLLGTAVSESLEKRVATARAVFILRLENESGLVSSVLVNGKDEVLAVGGRRDLRLAAKPASLAARVPGYEDQFLGVNWTAGGGQKVSVKPFVMAPLSLELVGETLGVLPFIKPLLVDDNGKTVMNQFGRCTLAPGLYTLTLSRADYQTQVQKIVLKAGDQQVRVKGGVWVPTVALQGLLDAEQAYRAQQYDVSAAHLSVGGQLEDVGHQEKKRNLEASVVAEYKRITSKYADACRDECFKQLCLQLPFKQAATELVLPDSPKIPEWVLQRFDKQTKDMLEKKGILTAEQENILKKAKDASVYFYELDPSAFNDTPINELAEAVKSGFKPSPEYVKLAENAFAQCQKKLKDLEKIGGPVVKITREKCKIAEDNLKIIQKAMSL